VEVVVVVDTALEETTPEQAIQAVKEEEAQVLALPLVIMLELELVVAVPA
tara:strand:+ start:141 stop:290 length:150 start_codon:yes stop_codon:yes gene_type:complete